MAAGDRYAVDVASVASLIRAWHAGAESVGEIAQRLGAIHGRFESGVPSALVAGLLGEVPLPECFAELAAATQTAVVLSHGLAQDSATLERNLNAYIKAEREAEARLKAVQAGEKSGGTGRPTGSPPGRPADTGAPGGDSSGSSSSGSSSGGGSPQPPRSPGPAQYADRTRVGEWINEAFEVLEADGVPASELNEAGVLLIIEHESGGNPNAVNDWDGNAAAGDPSRGLMQVIGATFDEYKLPGHDDIYDPVDNIVAGVRYALSRYGSIQNVPGVRSVDDGGSYVGY